MKHITIFREEDRYNSFPHIAYDHEGRLLLAHRRASKFSADAAKNGLATHHDPDSEICLVHSDDNGYNWDLANHKVIYKSPTYGVNDPAITVLANGDVLVRFVVLNIAATNVVNPDQTLLFSHRSEHGLVTTVAGNLVLKSNDGGNVWQQLNLTTVKDFPNSCSRDPILEMEDGSWLMPVYTGAPQRSDISWVIRSLDQGRTWCHPTMIACDDNGKNSQLQGINFNETSLLNMGSGRVIALIRADGSFHTDDGFMPVGGMGEIYLSQSFDSGLSWTKARGIGLFGQPAALTHLRDGRILATYGYRKKPYGVRCCISADEGRTWNLEDEVVIRHDSATWDCGYPFTIEKPDGSLFTVYYICDQIGVRFIAGTHWELA